MAYGAPCAVALDPVEKKPLAHFLPGRTLLSLGTAGCNLRCRNCQNASISQVPPDAVPSVALSPEAAVALAKREGACGIAYTYTEPLVAFEYVLDCAAAAREAGLANVLVTAGFVNPGPLARLVPFLDAANVDLKTMDDARLRENSGVPLAPVLATLRALARSPVHLEVTDLVIPGFNDAEGDLEAWCAFVAGELGEETPVHFSRFFPCHLLRDRPPTPPATLERAADIARRHGLRHVYLGNLDREETVFCAACGARLLVRRGYAVLANRLRAGACPDCGKPLAGRF